MLALVGLLQERFPAPEFESGYRIPVDQLVHSAPQWLRDLDVLFYGLMLVLAAWLLLRRRSRRGLALAAIAALLYFGFWRRGCICPVGSLANVARALCGDGAPPLTVLGLFFAPLLAAFFAGRAFCGAVCPLGALQDVVLLRPLSVPHWLEAPLSLLRHVYLGLVVLAVYTSGRFLVCRYDPFVGLFRFDGPAPMLAAGGGLLLLGIVVARPYCRYLCPYGVVLGWLARFTRNPVSVTHDACIRCGLCADACPFGAIRFYSEPPASRTFRFSWPLAGAALAALLLGALGGRLAGPAWARLARPVELLERVEREAGLPIPERSLEARAFAEKGGSLEELRLEAADAIVRFRRAGTWFGAWLGLVLGLAALRIRHAKAPTVVEVDQALCLGCGRCYESCPIHRKPKGPA